MKNEKGSILVETPIFVILLFSFGWGVWKIHFHWKEKLQKILADRNSKIEAIRMEKTLSPFSAGIPFFALVGLDANQSSTHFTLPKLGAKNSSSLRGK